MLKAIDYDECDSNFKGILGRFVFAYFCLLSVKKMNLA